MRAREDAAHVMQHNDDNPRASIGGNGGPAMFIGGEGWVAINRNLRKHWLVGFGQPVKPLDPSRGSLSRAEAWIDLIMECRYEGGHVWNGGRKMWIEPGQLLGGISFLSNRWNWSPQVVRTFLDKLENDGMINRDAPVADGGSNKHNGKQANVLTVCNYSTYQVSGEGEQQAQQQASNKQATSKQQASNNIYKDNKETRKQGNKDIPPAPQGGEPAADFELEGDPVTRADKANAILAEARGAIEDYNKAAKHLGLSTRNTIGEDLVKRVAKRLEEIGGRDRWRQALNRIRFNDFLMGRTAGRDGKAPFKLDIDKLLSTKSGLGDVLAKLIDEAATAGDRKAAIRWWQDRAQVEAMTLDAWRELIAKHVTADRNLWPIPDLGPAPGSPRCIVPIPILEEFKFCERFDDKGLTRKTWGKK